MKTSRRRFIQLASGLLVPASAYGQLTLRNSSYPTLFKPASGGFNPSDYGTVWAWYRHSTLSTYASGVWVDSSGNGRDTEQPTAGYRPTYSAASLNGLDALSFDGTAAGLNLPNTPDNVSVAMLIRPSLATASQIAYAPIYIGSSTGKGLRICVKIGSNNWGTFIGSDLSCGEALAASTNYAITGISNATNGTVIQRDGTTKATSGSESHGAGATAQLGSERGGSRYYAGLISEVLIYSTELTGANLTAVNDYMKGLGGIA